MTIAQRHDRGLLIEYALTPRLLVLPFWFNPATITRTRSVVVKTGGAPGRRGGYGFISPKETPRASQGVETKAETISFKILLDATDRINTNDPVAKLVGIQPEIDVINTMLEPKVNSEQGMADLNSVLELDTSAPAHSTHTVASVLLFKWNLQVLPVFLTQAKIEMKAFLPTLAPYRAEALLTLQIIPTNNPFYRTEMIRQRQVARSFASMAGLPAELLRF